MREREKERANEREGDRGGVGVLCTRQGPMGQSNL